MTARCTELETHLSTANDTCAETREALDAAMLQFNATTERCGELETALATSTERCSGLKTALATSTQRCGELEAEVASRGADRDETVAQLRRVLEEWTAKHDAVVAELTQAIADRDAAVAAVGDGRRSRLHPFLAQMTIPIPETCRNHVSIWNVRVPNLKTK